MDNEIVTKLKLLQYFGCCRCFGVAQTYGDLPGIVVSVFNRVHWFPSLSSPKKSKFLIFEVDTIATSTTLDIVI